MIRTLLAAVSFCALTAAQPPTPAESWSGFRGNGSGQTTSELPVDWSVADGVAWARELPGYGQSSPVVRGGRVYVTTAVGERKQTCVVLCFAAEDGESLWRHEFAAAQEIEAKDSVSRAAPTPAVDDERLVVFFESGDLVSLGLDGMPNWSRDFAVECGPFGGNHGLGSSPVLVGDTVILAIEHSGLARLFAIDADTGATIWSVRRSPRISWTTPVVHDGVVYSSSNGTVEAFDLDTGAPMWSHTGLEGNTVQSPFIVGDLLVVPASKPAGNMVLELVGAEQDESEIVWREGDVRPAGFASPVVVSGMLLSTNRAGVVTALDVRTGSKLWKQRTGGVCWASPIVSGGLVHYFAEGGTATVLRPRRDGCEVVATIEFEAATGRVYGVAAAGGRLFVREPGRLVCIGASGS